MRSVLFVVLALLLQAVPAVAQDLQALVRKCGPAVVVFRYSDGSVLGSGVLVSPDGVILTADHLFDDGEAFSVSLYGGETLPVKRFLYRDAEVDLAALEVNGKGLPFVRLADSEKVAIGARAIAIGNPEGLENSVSEGVISGKRAIDEDSFQIQTTAAISSGSSGGGLFDVKGDLLGITVSSLDEGQNLNFAVPVHYADLQSIRRMDKAIANAPSDIQGYLDRAQAYHDVQEYELALVDVKQALQLDPESAAAFRIRGEIYYLQERHAESLQDFTTVVRLAPDEPQSYFDRGFDAISSSKGMMKRSRTS